MPESTWESSQMNMKMFRRYAMRAGVVALCSAALCAVPMMAQGGGGGAPGGGGGGRGMMTPDAQLAQLVTALTLTSDQQAKIKPILEADAAKITALRTAQDPDMRTKMMAIRTEQHAAIKALLTADQATKYDAMPQGGRGGGGGAPPAAPPQ
jgi:protein CpxP